jgi:hypothetical protein
MHVRAPSNFDATVGFLEITPVNYWSTITSAIALSGVANQPLARRVPALNTVQSPNTVHELEVTSIHRFEKLCTK